MTYYRRRPADASVLASAVAAGAAIGAATFYLVKLWLQREPLNPESDLETDLEARDADEREDEGEGTGGGAVDRGGEPIDRGIEPQPETSEGTESTR